MLASGCGNGLGRQRLDAFHGSNSEPPKYMTTRIYVRFTPSTTKRLSQVNKGNREYLLTKEIPIDTLRLLGEKYRVLRWDSLSFIPEEEDVIGFRQIVTLTCALGVDVKKAANEFAHQSDLVEYALLKQEELGEKLVGHILSSSLKDRFLYLTGENSQNTIPNSKDLE